MFYTSAVLLSLHNNLCKVIYHYHSKFTFAAMIKTICVCGAGTMGRGIAQVAAQAGFHTILFDVNEEMLAKSKQAIQENLQRQVERNKMLAANAEATIQSLTFSNDISMCVADLIIEAIVENLDAKLKLFKQLSAINQASTVLATNTSSLSITEIAAHIDHPERVLGIHFFNPATAMQLVEIVKGKDTSQQCIDVVYNTILQFNKIPVLCADAPGFIVNRVARHYYLEAMHLVQQGLADIETVDILLENAGFKMGPFKLMDLIGIDVNYSVSEIVWNALNKPPRLTPSSLQKSKVDAGALGRKTGVGFYTYH